MKRNISRISFIVHQNQLFNVSDNLICGISGGQDSIILLIILYHLKKVYKLELTNIYCNHFWQVKNFYSAFEILKLSYLINTPMSIVLIKTKIKSEEEGHFWRQKAFFQIGNYFAKSSVVLGHTLTDQLETAFWHLFRGTSPKGLIGLKTINSLRINNLTNILFYISTHSKINFQRKNKIFTLKKKYFYQKKQKIKKFKITNFSSTNKKKLLLNLSKSQIKQSYNLYLQNKNQILVDLLNVQIYYIYYFQSEKIYTYQVKRPLLNFSRSSINKLIQQNTLPIINDNTNQSTQLIRNKIRLLIFPMLHYYIKSKCEIQIKSFLNINEIEQIYFEELSSKLIWTYLIEPELIHLLIKMPRGIKRICLNQLLQHYTVKQIRILFIDKFDQIATELLIN